MSIPVLPSWYVCKSSHESVSYNDSICKNFNTGIYRSTSLHVLSRLASPRVGLQNLLKDGQILAFNLYSVQCLLHKSQFDVSQEGVGSQGNVKMTL